MQYLVKTTIKHNGSNFLAGEKIELPKDMAEELLKSGSIEPVYIAFDTSRNVLKINLES